jgi:hypothetical protein
MNTHGIALYPKKSFAAKRRRKENCDEDHPHIEISSRSYVPLHGILALRMR